MDGNPIFFDPKGKRGTRVSRLAAVAGILTAIVTTAFVLTMLFVIPALPSTSGNKPHGLFPSLPYRKPRADFLMSKVRRQLRDDVLRNQKRFKIPPAHAEKVIAGFYTPWQDSGIFSLRANASKLTTVMPVWCRLAASGDSLDISDFEHDDRRQDVIDIARANGLRIVPVITNAIDDDWYPERVGRLFASPAAEHRLAVNIRSWLVASAFQGVNFDFENLDSAEESQYASFLKVLRAELDPYNLTISIDVQAGDDELPLEDVADQVDFLMLMAYDQHWESGLPGPIADLDWTQTVLERTLRRVPEDKVVMGIGNYSYDWKAGKPGAEDVSYEDALSTAQGYRDEPPSRVIKFDPDSLNSTFEYDDDDNVRHVVWMLDAVSAFNQWASAKPYGIRGAALWALGKEDPAIWTFFDKNKLSQPLDAKALEAVRFPYEVSYTGKGEILTVKNLPQQGKRTIDFDKSEGVITSAKYESYPFPYVIQKSGFVPKKLVLTFDDGPDRQFTGPILDTLKQLQVPATFFVVGKNARANPDLVQREYDQGDEIGSHTFLHPDLGRVSDWRASLELDATQRAIESVVGRSTVLFRPPYNADSQPENPDQVKPVITASKFHYIVVGENVDPQDWNLDVPLPGGGYRRKTAEDIASSVISTVISRAGTGDEGNIILLHDAGGDRSATIEALKILVPELKAKGYQFVTVADLLGKTRGQIMPAVRPQDRMLLLLDRIVFGAVFGLDSFLAIAFIVAIALGLSRIVFIAPLAIWHSIQRSRKVFSPTFRPPVTALIAAYNEDKVIVRTIQSILASEYPVREVVVVDDGSTDATARTVQDAFRDDDRVVVISQQNTGKAGALNAGIEAAGGEILFCVDADTQLDPKAVGALVRHFEDAEVGAVAGNVRVGNRHNLLTTWQAIEYTTSQNLDRRAYALLNAITVVPGAIGAWRKQAIVSVGGYQRDTLAEDMDLTWRLRRAGWTLENEAEAIAYTEAPDTLRSFFKQRFRWAFGTLQCLCKHRSALFRYGWFGWLALPALWLFQVAFQVLAPLVDLQVVYSLGAYGAAVAFPSGQVEVSPLAAATQNLGQVGFLYALFFAVELLAGVVAYKMERRPMGVLWWLFLQRFCYRQIMYGVICKSVTRALHGNKQSWGKLERTGAVALPPDPNTKLGEHPREVGAGSDKRSR